MNTEKRIRILAVLCIISLTVMTASLLFSNKSAGFTPPPFDPDAQTGIPEAPPGTGYRALDAGAFRVALCGKITTQNGSAAVYLTNPDENTVWLKLRILDEQGTMLGETGLIRPGEYVRLLNMHPLPMPGNPITLKIMAYEPNTYHSMGSVTVNTCMGE